MANILGAAGGATDFAKNSFGGAIALLNQFNNGAPQPWDIFEASYLSNASIALKKDPVLFLIFESQASYSAAVSQIVDQQGRRKVKYQYPYRDGQTTDDLGRKPGAYTFNVLIFGDNYLVGLQNLISELNDPTPGILTHPIFGDIQVVPTDFSLTHSHEQRKAVQLSLSFEEHNFSIAQLTDITPVDKTVTSKLAKLAAAFGKIANVIDAVKANVQAVQSVKNGIVQSVQEFQTGFAALAASLNATFNPGGPTLPALLPVNVGGLQNSDGTLNTTPSTVISPSDPFASVPVSSLSQGAQVALATQTLSKNMQTQRDNITAIIESLKAVGNGQGGLVFHDNILDLKTIAIDMQDALEAGIASSNSRVVQYVTPWDMTVREVAFANGLTPGQGIEIALLNPQLGSLNQIPSGTSLMVAVS